MSALWLGVLTSISPCPLATNIAAISSISRRVDSTPHVLLAGLLYTVGRMAAYLGLAFILVSTALSVPQVSLFLQKYMHLLVGPMLVLVGMVLVGLIQIDIGGPGVSDGLKQRIDSQRSRYGTPIGGCTYVFQALRIIENSAEIG